MYTHIVAPSPPLSSTKPPAIIAQQDKTISATNDRLRAVDRSAEPSTQHESEPQPEEIEPLLKPNGEAGDKKKGFKLRKAMRLRGKKNKLLFNAIQVSVFDQVVLSF